RRAGPPLLLRNNRDGTFRALPIFPGVEGLRAFAWGDLDNDGAPDAALVDARGKLHVFANESSGQFRRRTVEAPACAAVAVADVNDDGTFDLVALGTDGQVTALLDRDKGAGWEERRLFALQSTGAGLAPGQALLAAADLDNNGALDWVVGLP